MGVLVGLLAGLGLFLVVRSAGAPPPARRADRTAPRDQVADLLAQAGVDGVTPAQLITASAALGGVVVVVVTGVSRVPAIGLAFGVFAGAAPLAVLRARRERRRRTLRDAWPEAVDHLGSGIRAGLALPEALASLGERGPQVLQPSFARFAADYRSSGRFGESLDRLKVTLADPVGDRVVEALRLAREVGGSDLGRLLRTLSSFLRDDARTRGELETRQGWTVSAARLALAAPWLVLLLLSTRPAAVAAYRSAPGAIVLAVGGAVSFVAYRLMLRIARLPVEQRVLR